MIQRFSKEEFEAALPRPDRIQWQHVGLIQGEHCYVVAVRSGVLIYIRSSVRVDGLAADTAQDSIRCWLAADVQGAPLSGKVQRYITRVNGWEKRLLETLRSLWRLGRQLEPCPRCGNTAHAFRVKNEGENKGRWFASCPNCKQFIKWLNVEPQKKESK